MYRNIFSAFLCVVGLNAYAAANQLNSAWHFTRTDGVTGQVRLFGEYVSCTVYPAGKEDNMSIEIENLKAKAASCYEGASAPAFVDGAIQLNPAGPLVNAQVTFGTSFVELMSTFKQLGETVVGPIGGGKNGLCKQDATAFLGIPGWAVGDPNEEIIGYCLVP
jgi:hypothetical protein